MAAVNEARFEFDRTQREAEDWHQQAMQQWERENVAAAERFEFQQQCCDQLRNELVVAIETRDEAAARLLEQVF